MGTEKHLLIDGSNILHAWPELRMMVRENRDVARELLIEKVRVIHDLEAVRITVVFDGRGSDLLVEHPGGLKTFSQIFTPAGTTADDIIEQLVAHSAVPANCTVATGDRAERLTVEASGAVSITADALLAWVTRAEQRQKTQLASRCHTNEKNWNQQK